MKAEKRTNASERHFDLLVMWVIEQGFATGHAETQEDLLEELSWQIKEIRKLNNER